MRQAARPDLAVGWSALSEARWEDAQAAFSAALARDETPEALAASFAREFGDLARTANVGPPGGPAEYTYEYLLVVARRGR